MPVNLATDLNANNKDEHEELVDPLQIVGALCVTGDQRILRRLGGQNHHQLHQQHSKADGVGDSHTEPGDAACCFGRDLNQSQTELHYQATPQSIKFSARQNAICYRQTELQFKGGCQKGELWVHHCENIFQK